MPDITMCDTKMCPKRDTCYRFTAKPDKYQSYSLFESVCNEKVGYEFYWDNKEYIDDFES